jgi:dipeptidyl aminopeptidase/acylaminoacyl peptidase
MSHPVRIGRAQAAAPVTIALAAGVVAAAPPTHSSASSAVTGRMIEKQVWIQSGDHMVPGTYAYPKAGGTAARYPAVLMLHGFGSTGDEVGNMYLHEAQQLALRGYASLRIDFAGSGLNPQPFTENTYDGMVADSLAALDWLIAQRNTNDARIGILGFSLGGKLVATIGGTDQRVKALASWSGAIENGIGSLAFLMAYYPEALANGHVVVDLGWRTVDLSIAWYQTMMASTALDQLAGYAGPMLLVAGELDTTVDPDVSRHAAGASGSFDVTLRIIPGADHIYLVLTPDQALANGVISLTADWFKAKL